MGQKINPVSFRLGVNKTWDSRWYATGETFAKNILEDHNIRKYLNKSVASAGVAKIIIERNSKKVIVNLHVARPGVVIGKKGAGVEDLKKAISKMVEGDEVVLNIVSVKKPDSDAKLIALGIAKQIEKRISYRKAMKKAVQQALRSGVRGVRVSTKGRLAEADIARRETYKEGRVPLHTLRADIDYATAEAFTTYGIIGTKVWLYKDDIVAKRSAKDIHSDIFGEKKNGINTGVIDDVKS